MLQRVVRLKRILPSTLAAIFGIVLLIAAYRATVDKKLLERNLQLEIELERLQAQHFHRAQQVELLNNQIQRLQTVEGEELFQARLRLGMIREGEVVYQFPHGRDKTWEQEHQR